jgi:hypothetical protein
MARHLNAEQLVDLAEGTLAERATPHLDECDTCRRALAQLRATLLDAGAVPGERDVPEPSPLFWEHLSARVRESVAAEGLPHSVRWLERWRRALEPRFVWPALVGVAGACVLAVVASRPPAGPLPIPAKPLPVAENTQLPSLPPLEPLGVADDPSLNLMADYGTTLAWDDIRQEMALDAHAGGTDEAVIALSAEERQELQRLLEEEMSQPSALGAS